MRSTKLTALILILVALSYSANLTRGEVIAYDTDTLKYAIGESANKFFDFLTMRTNVKNESLASDTFVAHVGINMIDDSLWGRVRTYGRVDNTLNRAHGKISFDEITLAEPDLMKNDFGTASDRFFQVPFSEISSLKGNCYSMRLTDDPRMGYAFVKLKILDVIVKDTATRSIEVPFLWLCNYGGFDLSSPFPLDTLDGKVGVTTAPKTAVPFAITSVGTALTFSTPLPAGSSLALYDLSGRKIVSGEISGATFALPQIASGIYIAEILSGKSSVVQKISIR